MSSSDREAFGDGRAAAHARLAELVGSLVECPICCETLQNACEVLCCHASFCAECLRSWCREGRNATCPLCREGLNREEGSLTSSQRSRLVNGLPPGCRPNVILQRLANEFPEPCANAEAGCQTIVARADAASHAASCEFAKAKMKEKREGARHILKAEFEALKSRPMVDENLRKAVLAVAENLLAAQQFVEAIEAAQFALHLELPDSESCGLLFLVLARSELESGKLAASGETLQSALGRVGTSNPLRAQFQELQGEVLLKQGRLEDADRCFSEAIKDVDSTSALLAKLLLARAKLCKKRGKYEGALELCSQVLKLGATGPDASNNDETTNEEPYLTIIEAQILKGDCYRKENKFTSARPEYEAALAKLQGRFGRKHPLIAPTCLSLGQLHKKEGRYSDALQLYRRAQTIWRRTGNEDHPDMGVCRVAIGDVHRKLGNFQMAEEEYEAALAILEKTLGKDHIEVADVWNSQGLVKKKRARYDEAVGCYQRAIEIASASLGASHYKVGTYLFNLGDVHRKRMEWEDASRCFTRSKEVLTATLGARHIEVGEVLHSEGIVLREQGQTQQAMLLLREAIDIAQEQFGPRHYKVGMFSLSKGLAEAQAGLYDEAHASLGVALRILTDQLGRDNVEVADCHAALGDTCMKLMVETHQRSKLTEAKDHFEEARRIVVAAFGEQHTKAEQYGSLLFICDNWEAFS